MQITDEKCPIIKKKIIAENIFELKVYSEFISQNALPGQFVKISIDSTLIRRPFSIGYVDRRKNAVSFFIKIAGKNTKFLYESNIKEVKILGPLGNSFPIDNLKKVIMIGGGIGVAPLYFLYREVPIKKYLFYGVKKENEIIPHIKNLKNAKIIVEEKEGNILERIRKEKFNIEERIFVCGPPFMLLNAKKILYNYKNVYYSFESIMGCGLGICLGCVIPVKDGFKRVCYEGPIFKQEEIDWDKYEKSLK